MKQSLFKKIYTFTIMSGFVMIFLMVSVVWSYKNVELAQSQDDFARQVYNAASSLHLLARLDDIYSEKYDQRNWKNTHSKLDHIFAEAPKFPKKLESLKLNIEKQSHNVNRVFQLVQQKKARLIDPKVKNHFRSKMAILLDVMSDNARQLSLTAHENINRVVKQEILFIFIILGLGLIVIMFGALNLINVFKKSHNKLTQGFKDNSHGQFQPISLSNKYIEFDTIVVEFNKMIHKLNDTNVALAERTKLLEQLSNTDPLTKAYNRRHLYERGNIEFSRSVRTGAPLSLIMLDCDHFKKVNDTYGHLFGDKVLKLICKVCTQEVREVDIVARFGGEEFVIILPDCGLQGGVDIARRVQTALGQQYLVHNNMKVFFTVSIGVSTVLPTHERFEQLVSDADKAMYQAKNNGRNIIEVIKNTLTVKKTH